MIMSGPEARVRSMTADEPLDDGVDVQARDVDGGKARRRLVEHHGEVGAGEQDRLDAVAPLQVGGDAAQAGGVVGVGLSGVSRMR